MKKIYMCIDLKSFYASVECIERGLDPLNTNLVVADESRTEKTVCLAITPSLKQYGLGGRARLFEVMQKVKNINYERRKKNNYKKFNSKSYLDSELKKDKTLELDFIIAPPQMKKYMKYSTNIYSIYLKYLAPEDIFVYSIDEVFCDITNYLNMYQMTPKELVSKIIKDVYETTGITATAGIGTNMYLAKVSMDIVAKHTEPNEIGVRILEIVKDEIDEEYSKKYITFLQFVTNNVNLDWYVDERLQEINGSKNGKTLVKFYHSLCRLGLCNICREIPFRITSNGTAKPCLLSSVEDVNLFEGDIDKKLKKVLEYKLFNISTSVEK